MNAHCSLLIYILFVFMDSKIEDHYYGEVYGLVRALCFIYMSVWFIRSIIQHEMKQKQKYAVFYDSLNKKELSECGICYEENITTFSMCKTCVNGMCKGCFKEWFKFKRKCPYCNLKV